jgi:predicted AlkP superfamily phosphohydrolase/phosphomutase
MLSLDSEFLEFSASNVVFGPMQWGPVRKIARKAYDLLGLIGKVSLPQSVNWSKTKAFTTIRSTGEGVSINLAGREPDGIVDPADFERTRDQVMDALASFVDPATYAADRHGPDDPGRARRAGLDPPHGPDPA